MMCMPQTFHASRLTLVNLSNHVSLGMYLWGEDGSNVPFRMRNANSRALNAVRPRSRCNPVGVTAVPWIVEVVAAPVGSALVQRKMFQRGVAFFFNFPCTTEFLPCHSAVRVTSR